MFKDLRGVAYAGFYPPKPITSSHIISYLIAFQARHVSVNIEFMINLYPISISCVRHRKLLVQDLNTLVLAAVYLAKKTSKLSRSLKGHHNALLHRRDHP